MKNIKLAFSALTVTLALGASQAMAQGLPKMPSFGGGSSSAPSANGAEVAKNARNALYAFAKAQTGLASALGGYADLSAQMALLDSMKAGDAAAKKEDVDTLVSISKSAQESINKKAAENAELEGDNKLLAANSMTAYVKGLVASKKLISSIQGLMSNPISMGADAPTLIATGKELPGIVSTGASSTTALFSYLGSKGVDLAEAKTAANGLGT